MTRKPLLLVAALLAAATALVLGGVPGTMATFSDTATIGTGSISAGAVATPAAPSAAQTAPTDVTIEWTPTSVGSDSAKATSYDVLRFSAANGGAGTLVCSVTGLTCIDTSAPSGTSYYLLRAKFATNWTKDSARVAYTPDTTAPTLTIMNPIDSCSGSVAACGTASDTGSGVEKVEYTLRRVRTFFLGGTAVTCWNGASWVGPNPDNSCPFALANGTTSWQVPGAKSAVYADSPFLFSYMITLTARATDAAGNVSTVASAPSVSR